MEGLQLEVFISTIVIGILTLLLAARITQAYMRNRARSHLFWSIGLWAFCISVFIESAFAANIVNPALVDSYFFLVVVIVSALSLGSIQLIKSGSIKKIYYAFTAIMLLATLVSIVTADQGNPVVTYVAAGVPSTSALYTSLITTFTAAAVIVIVAAMSYLRKRSYKMLSIILGVIIVSVAGTLYIVSFPEFLYYSEFIGILLLWIGFI